MHHPAAHLPPRDISGRTLGALAVAATALVGAFVVAPGRLAASAPTGGFADEQHLAGSFRAAFVRYWTAGDRQDPPDLAGIIDYWFRYHLAKAAIAAAALVLLVTLAAVLWRAFLQTPVGRKGRAAALAGAGAGTTSLALVALAAVMANVQGALAPFSSLMPMLMTSRPDPELAGALGSIRHDLSASLRTGAPTSPALDRMVGDSGWYHVAMAVIAAVVALAFAVAALVFRRRLVRTAAGDRRARRLWGSFVALSLVLTLAAIVLAAANAGTAADPGPALLDLFAGGW